MKTATLAQGVHVLDLVRAKEIPLEQLQEVLKSGLLSDLLDANIGNIDRNEFRKICGLGPVNVDGFQIWKTIKLGVGPKNADEFRSALRSAGFRIGDYANDILGKTAFKVSAEEIDVDLVVVSVAELGFKNGAAGRKIFDRIKGLGFELCSSDVGPQLRLVYADQPKGEWLVVAMEPIPASDGHLDVFHVERDDYGRWLDAYYNVLDGTWDPDSRFVIRRPRK